MQYFNILLFILFLLPFPSIAQDTLHVGSQFDTSLLKLDQTKTYVHYQEFKDGRIVPRSIKTISIKNDSTEFVITQKEFTQGHTKSMVTVVNNLNLTTFTHIRRSDEKLESYKFNDHSVTGIPNDKEAANQNFMLELSEPTFNFEIDFIFLQSIDWNKHDSVVINFYHPGGKLPPAYYTFEKEKEEKLILVDGVGVDTWVIYTDYNGQPPSRFWISKETNEIILNETDAMEMAGFLFRKQLIGN